jgi:hypothetical protein
MTESGTPSSQRRIGMDFTRIRVAAETPNAAFGFRLIRSCASERPRYLCHRPSALFGARPAALCLSYSLERTVSRQQRGSASAECLLLRLFESGLIALARSRPILFADR